MFNVGPNFIEQLGVVTKHERFCEEQAYQYAKANEYLVHKEWKGLKADGTELITWPKGWFDGDVGKTRITFRRAPCGVATVIGQ